MREFVRKHSKLLGICIVAVFIAGSVAVPYFLTSSPSVCQRSSEVRDFPIEFAWIFFLINDNGINASAGVVTAANISAGRMRFTSFTLSVQDAVTGNMTRISFGSDVEFLPASNATGGYFLFSQTFVQGTTNRDLTNILRDQTLRNTSMVVTAKVEACDQGREMLGLQQKDIQMYVSATGKTYFWSAYDPLGMFG